MAFALEPFDFDSIGSYQRENKQAIKKAQSLAEMEVQDFSPCYPHLMLLVSLIRR